MHPRLFLFFLIIFSTSLFAQENKAKFFIETGVKIFGGGDYQNFVGKTGISFNQTTKYWKYLQSDDVHSDSRNNLSYSFAPRVGYYLSERISSGVDFQYYYSKDGYYYFNWFFEKYRIATGGIFLRYYFSIKKISPFIEAKTGWGTLKEETLEPKTGGGEFIKTEYQNLFYYSFNAGASFRLNNSFKLNLSAMAQNTIEKFSDKSNFSTSTFKHSDWEIGPMLSVIYIFKGKSKKEEKLN